jgi:hypothetical protein
VNVGPSHALILSIEVVSVQEQEDSASPLVGDARSPFVGCGASGQDR